jgi:chromosome segregation ATPase
MARRQALVIEGDATFVSLLHETLAPYDIEVVALNDARQAFLRLKADRPAVLFLSAELPDRKGFTHCTRARRSARGVPIVLATGSIPWNEMTMHEITRAHADGYLDKRGLEGAKVLRLLDRLVELGPPKGEAKAAAPDLVDDLERELTRPARHATTPAPRPVPQGCAEMAAGDEEIPNDLASLRSEVECLRREAQGARRSRSNPGETMLLRDELQEREREIAQFARKVFEVERALSQADERLTGLTLELDTERAESEALRRSLAIESQRLGETTAALANSTNALDRLRLEADEALRHTREVHQDELRGFEQRLAGIEAARVRAEKAEGTLQQDCTRLARNLAALEEERQRRDREIKEALLRAREEQRAALFAARLEHESVQGARDKAQAAALEQALEAQREAAQQALQAEVDRLEAERRLEAETESGRHEKALAALRRIHSEMLTEHEERWQGALERIRTLEGSQTEDQAALSQRAYELDALRERLAEREQTLAERKREIAHTEAVIARHEGMIGDGARQAEELVGDIRQLERQLEDAHRERQALEARRSDLERKIVEGHAERSALREQFAALEAAAAERQGELRALAGRNEGLADELAQARRLLGEREGALRQQQEHTSIVEAARAAAVEQRDALERQLVGTREAASTHEREALATARSEQERETEALRRELDAERTALAERERQFLAAQARESEAAWQKAVAEMDLRRQDEVREREAALRRELAELRAETERSTEVTLAEARAALEKARREIVQLEDELAARDRILPTLEAELTDQRETISSLQAVVSDFSTGGEPTERPKLPPE